MIALAKAAQKTPKGAGHDLSIADIQAILGDYQKRLYGELGARKTADVSYQEIAQKAGAAFQHDRGRPGTEVDGGAFVEGPDGLRLRVDSTERIETLQRFNLYVGHNISERGLYFANELGGLPAPSIAVARADLGFDSFGEITLLTDRKARTFPADACTARQPRGVRHRRWRLEGADRFAGGSPRAARARPGSRDRKPLRVRPLPGAEARLPARDRQGSQAHGGQAGS
jgi:hypothetical protein